ncbi:hypothetical protein EVAR_98301_1 [Eumeta japonica]|uniref:Mariner Mos1 transposase n=1 Tax=Eumeta variegata TaxID=151549 RepID=A0A4C1XDZ3_EUMVA|nr:hypothetical protein EVAR_98301_1 [Eumeta japonica]
MTIVVNHSGELPTSAESASLVAPPAPPARRPACARAPRRVYFTTSSAGRTNGQIGVAVASVAGGMRAARAAARHLNSTATAVPSYNIYDMNIKLVVYEVKGSGAKEASGVRLGCPLVRSLSKWVLSRAASLKKSISEECNSACTCMFIMHERTRSVLTPALRRAGVCFAFSPHRGLPFLSVEFCNGRSSTLVNNKNINAVHCVIETDKHETYHEIQTSLSIGNEQMQSILRTHFGMKKVVKKRWISYNQKTYRDGKAMLT